MLLVSSILTPILESVQTFLTPKKITATRSFKSCGINNALDGTEDDAVWDDEEEEAEDAEEPIDNEFETDSEGEDDE